MTDRDIDTPSVRSRERYHACRVLEWFEVLTKQYGSQEKAYRILNDLVGSGLRLYAAEPRYVGHTDSIHTSHIRVPISKAKLARRIDTGGLVTVEAPVEGGTTFKYELSFHELYIVRSNLQEACQSMGVTKLPWPDDEFSFYWESVIKVRELKETRDRISDIPAKNIDEERWKESRLAKLDREIATLEEKLGPSKAASLPRPISTPERKQMLKIMLGMAMVKYEYDPKEPRNHATGENRGSIAADMQTIGLETDSDTIRKYLTEAANLFPDATQRKPST